MNHSPHIPTPPGPKRRWPMGHAPEQVTNPLGLLVNGHQKFGDIVYYHLYEGPTYLLCHPDYVQHVLVDNVRNYHHPSGGAGSPLLGTGLFVSEGDFWRRQRRMVQPAFHRAQLAEMVKGMVEGVQIVAERWQQHARTGEPLELMGQLRKLVISLLGTSILSRDVYETDEQMRMAIDVFSEDMHTPMDTLWKAVLRVLGLPRSRIKRFLNAVEMLDARLYSFIAERRKAPEAAQDVLSMLLSARDTQGEAMTDRQVRDELVSLLVAGHEATSIALTWTWYVLASRPEVEQRVRQELAEVLGGQPPTAESLQALQYTRAVVEETLRVYSPAWQIARKAVAEDQIAGWTIPAGTMVMMSPYILHRHPAGWDQPEQFMPERFLPGYTGRRHRQAYLPFGGGQRLCIGNSYAVTLMVVAVATLLQRFRLRLLPDPAVVPQAASTYRPRNGVKITLHPL